MNIHDYNSKFKSNNGINNMIKFIQSILFVFTICICNVFFLLNVNAEEINPATTNSKEIIATTDIKTGEYALDLKTALTNAYDYNDDLKAAREIFLTDIEAFPQAIANGFMPKIDAKIDSVDNKTSPKTKLNINNQLRRTIRQDNITNQKALIIDQPIFNGGGSVAAVKSAQYKFKASRSKYYAQEQETIFKLIQAYTECVEAQEKYNISKISVDSNQAQHNAMSEKFKYGEATKTEVATTEANLAAAKANQSATYAEFADKKSNFVKLFGVEPVNVTMPILPNGIPDSLEVLINKSIDMNPNTEQAKYNISIAKSQEYIAKSMLLPNAKLSLQQARTRYKPENTEPTRINKSDTTATLSVQIPILHQGGAEYSKIREAKSNTRQAAISQDNVIKQIIANSRSSFERLAASKQRLDATIANVEAAEIAYNGMVQEEKYGSKTIVDVVIAEDKLHQARIQRVEAEKALILSAYQIKSLMGELTAYSLKLPVKYFSPEREFKKIKVKMIGM